jgi:hypothetical protein
MAMDPRVVLDGLVFPEGPRWRDGLKRLGVLGFTRP